MRTFAIEEEYGYRYWVCRCSDEEAAEIIRRWKTMKGLNCLVAVTMLFPKAIECEFRAWRKVMDLGATAVHMHECEDSQIKGVEHDIPETEDGSFWLDGKQYDPNCLFKRNNS